MAVAYSGDVAHSELVVDSGRAKMTLRDSDDIEVRYSTRRSYFYGRMRSSRSAFTSALPTRPVLHIKASANTIFHIQAVALNGSFGGTAENTTAFYHVDIGRPCPSSISSVLPQGNASSAVRADKDVKTSDLLAMSSLDDSILSEPYALAEVNRVATFGCARANGSAFAVALNYRRSPIVLFGTDALVIAASLPTVDGDMLNGYMQWQEFYLPGDE